MVFFTCDYCNESLKKNQVDKHCYKCRSCESVTCVDCSVTFWGNDYATHTTCVTEAEKYEKSLYKGKQKLSPQDRWMNTIATAIANYSQAPSSIQSHLQKMCDYSNIPRNKNKFANFLKNSLKVHTQQTIDIIWEYLSKKNEEAIGEIDSSKLADIKPVEDVVKEDIVVAEENSHNDDSKKSKKKRKERGDDDEVSKSEKKKKKEKKEKKA